LDPKNKQPYAIALADKATFAFAGLWDRWRQATKEVIESFTIIMTDPNELIVARTDTRPHAGHSQPRRLRAMASARRPGTIAHRSVAAG
jgi:hypothetical protein